MKICIISNLYTPYIIGGAEISVQSLAEELSREHEVTVITSAPFKGIRSLFPKAEIIKGVKVYRFYPLNLYWVYSGNKKRKPVLLRLLWHILDLFNLHALIAGMHIVNKEKPDVIHSNNLTGLSYSLVLAAKIFKVPLVHHLRDYSLLCPYSMFICPYTEYKACSSRPFPCGVNSFFKRLTVGNTPKAVIGLSEHIISVHKKYGFFEKTITKKIPNFIETHPESKIKSRSEEGTLNILCAGRLSREKGVDVLLDGFMEMKDAFLRLHVIGEGEERAVLEEKSRADKRVKFYGQITPDELRKFYQMADILVVPSVWQEPLGRVVLEAFSYSIPVIGSRIGGIKELIRDRHNGLLFEAGSKSDLKDKLRIFVDDFKKNGTLLAQCAQGACESSTEYSAANIVEQVVGVYNELVHGSGRPEEEN